MSSHVNSVRTAGLAVLAVLVFGCGSPASGSGAATSHRFVAQQGMTGAQKPQADQSTMTGPQDPEQGIIAALHPTQEQTEKVKALLADQEKPSVEALRQRVQTLKQLLADKDIDVAKLISHLKQDREQVEKNLSGMVDVIAGIHDILTPEQRAKLAQLRAPAAVEETSEAVSDLKLNDQQRQALEALKPTMADKSLQDAIHTFLQSHDRAALEKAVSASIQQLPTAEAMAKALASLSYDQRQTLIKVAAEAKEAQ